MRKTLIAAALAGLSAAPAIAFAADAAPASPHSFSGNLTIASDYRFRGISQTWKQPTLQGGVDYSHANGLYLGNWNSTVSGNSYNNGGGIEMDFYGGYKFNITKTVQGDIGVLYYYYPGANLNSAPGVKSNNKYNNTEIYFGLNVGAFSGKLSYATSDYFGLNTATSGYAFFAAPTGTGGSRGTTYLDLNYSFDLGNGVGLALHAGRTSVRNYGQLSYTDYKVALTKDISGWVVGAAVVGTNANKDFYQIADSQWLNPKTVGETTLVLSVTKTF